MRLLKIGRSPSCNIVLNSDKASALHAEITVLDNGDILLVDKNSTNGTFVGNTRINPNTEVTIQRGDYVCFGNVELQWAQVPMPEDNSKYKAIYSIGTNFKNDIQIDGATVSRFHATLKITKDNKAFIKDHSKNGTTINGVKIKTGEECRVKRGDAVACGGVPVDLSEIIPKPIPPILLTVIYGAGGAAVLVGLVVLIMKFITPPVTDFVPATVYVHAFYYYEVELTDDPFVEMFRNTQTGETAWTETWTIDNSSKISDKEPIGYSGTAFFIDKKGRMGTNRHVAVPWEYTDADTREKINQTMAEMKETYIPVNRIRNDEDLTALYNASGLGKILAGSIARELKSGASIGTVLNKYNALINRFKTSPIKISGRMSYMAVGYAKRNYTSLSEFDRCTVVKESKDPKIDIAILQLNTQKTPEDIKIYDVKKARVDVRLLKPQAETLYTIGYPAGLGLGLRSDHGVLEPEIREVKCSKSPGEYNFEFQGEAVGGASGSPIFDKKGTLVGVLYGGYTVGATFGEACQIKYLKEMYDKVSSRDE